MIEHPTIVFATSIKIIGIAICFVTVMIIGRTIKSRKLKKTEEQN